MKKLLQFLMTMFLSVAMVGCYSTDEPVGPDVPVVGALKLSQEEMTVGAEGGKFSVDIFTEYAYETSTNVDWITISGGSCGTEYCTLYFTIAKNNTTSEREGVITVFCDDYNLSATLTVTQVSNSQIPNNEIWYTSSDDAVVEPYATDVFGANIVSNTYENGQGVIKFDGKVTQIGEWAFQQCNSLTSITIPDSVTTIGDGAFVWCYSLTSIIIPDSVTSIGKQAFHQCESLASITIPNSVTSIGWGAFFGCLSLKAFYGELATEDNRCLIVDGVLTSFAPAGLTEYTIPDGVTSIERNTFGYCRKLTKITIPDSVTSIGYFTFSYCTSLKEVYCKPTIPPIGDSLMFDSNASGRKIYVPAASVEAYKAADYWKDYADYIIGYDFEKGEVAAPQPANNEIWYTSTDDAVVEPYVTDAFGANIVSNTYENGQGVITFDGDVTQIGEQAFYANSSTSDGRRLTTITIPDSVTSIGTRTFHGCTSLKAFYGKFASADNRCLIVDGVLNSFAIGCGATEYTIPDSVTSIERSAFFDCTSLTSVTIPDSVTSISTYANPFQRCSRLKYFYGKFASEDNRCLIVGKSLYSFAIGCGLREYTIPNNVISIRQGAFYNCSSLTSVTIPDGVTSIHSLVFYLCVNLKEVYCKPTTPPTGARLMFDNNATGRKIYVPAASVEAYKTAKYWSDYADYIFPDATESTNNKIFYTSSDGAVVEPYATSGFGANIVSNIYENGQGVITFDGDVTQIGERAFYKCATLTSITIPDSVTSIRGYAFHSCTKLTSVTIPDSVTLIRFYAFGSCTSLTSVTIPDDVTEIDAYAFSRCSSLKAFYGKFASSDNRCLIVNGVLNSFAPAGLTEYTIPDSVTSIGQAAFRGCTSLTSVTIPDSVTSIGYSAFDYCTSLKAFYGKFASADNRCLIVNGALNSFAPAGLTEYTIPDSVTLIGSSAFYVCTSLTSVTIPDSVTSIGTYAFQSCTSLTSVTIPDSVTKIGWYAFYNCTLLTSVIIPESVTSIGYYVFGGCSSLTNIYCKPTTPPTAVANSSNYWNAFDSNATDRKIYVPAASVEAYKAAQYWSDYASYIEGHDF